MAKNVNLNEELELNEMELDLDTDLGLDDDLDIDFDSDFDIDLEEDFEEEDEKPVKSKTTKKEEIEDIELDDDLDISLEEGEEEMDFDFEEEIEDPVVIEPKPEPKPEPKKETKKSTTTKTQSKPTETKSTSNKVTKTKPVEVVKEEDVEDIELDDNEELETVEETKPVRGKSKFQQKLQLTVDKRSYSRLFDNIVMTKVNAYNEIQQERAKGKTSRIPTSKAISRADFTKLMKSKVYSDEKYLKTFIKLFASAGMDQTEALDVLLKDKISNKAYSELFELVMDTMEDVLKAEAGVVLLAKDDIRATLSAEYKSEEIRDISSLKKTDKYTHVRKSDYYKVTCKSPVLPSKIEGGIMDENNNFAPVKKETKSKK